MIIAALLMTAQRTWAQQSRSAVGELVPSQAYWTDLSEELTAGATLGHKKKTMCYHVRSDRKFINSTAGGSGLKILGTVYIYVPEGVTLTCTGGNAKGASGAGAGIELPEGQTLYIVGSGTVRATGGNAANGGNGKDGDNADYGWGWDYYYSGRGGTGGYGGGGAGAGIGTCGGNGGDAGKGAEPAASG